MIETLSVHEPLQVHVVCQDVEVDPLEVMTPVFDA